MIMTAVHSPALSDEDDLYIKSVTKKKKMTDFFEKGAPKAKEAAPTARRISKNMKPASPPKLKAKPKVKAKSLSSSDDDDDYDYDALPVPKKSAPAPARAARKTAAAAKKYIELTDDDEGGGDEDGSMFVDE